MAKVTIKVLQERLEIQRKTTEDLAEQLVDERGNSQRYKSELNHARSEGARFEQALSRGEARFQELLVAHDILLKLKMRADGVEWDEINRIIESSRQAARCAHSDPSVRRGPDTFGGGLNNGNGGAGSLLWGR